MAPDPTSNPLTRRHRGISRVRSGCRTCKIRRVKCDEQRPSCAKCVGSGRSCDGYGIWDQPVAKPRMQTWSVSYPPQSLPGLDQQEKSHLDRFRHLVSGRLSEPFGSYFWNSLVLQMALSEPAVVHASIALTSAYELFLSGFGSNAAAAASTMPFLLRQYNRAIRALTTKVESNDSLSLRTAAVSSVLFICLETLRGDPTATHTHFRSGVKILTQLQRIQDRSSVRKELVLVPDDPQIYDDHLATVFSQLNLQFMMLGNSSQQKETFVSPIYYNRRIHIPPYFRTGDEARRSFTSILVAITYLCKEFERNSMTSDIHLPEPSTTESERQRALQTAVQEWIASYDRSIGSLLPSASQPQQIGFTMLRIYAHAGTIILGTCLSIKETAYDPYLSDFEAIVRRYEDLQVQATLPLTSSGRRVCETNSCFTIDTGFFPPLYFVALKCRNHAVRRKALALLQQYPSMEGPWTGPMLARVAGRVADLEEKDFVKALQSLSDAGSSPTLSSDTDDSQPSSTTTGVVLPEFCRIHCVECKLPSRYNPNPDTAVLTLRRFRHELGRSGGWIIDTAEVDLSGIRRLGGS
ncbi:hypothetical protein BJX64DRAFT_20791 [Aspergillus heterothallicus]